jgi:hypothetical protein
MLVGRTQASELPCLDKNVFTDSLALFANRLNDDKQLIPGQVVAAQAVKKLLEISRSVVTIRLCLS